VGSIKKLDQELPLVVCECGSKILVVPDLGEIVSSIEAHATTHEKNEADPEKAKSEHCRIEELLAQKVLIRLAKIRISNNKKLHIFTRTHF
jgi:hypothetical protein